MPWYGWTIFGVLALFALWAVGALVIGDRARGLRRCPKCWHSMEGLPDGEDGGWVCPECGRAVLREKDLFCTRRKHRVLAVAAVGLLAGLAWYGYGVRQRWAEGKTAWVPSLGAVLLVRPAEFGLVESRWNRVLRDTIARRRTAGNLSDWHCRVLMLRFVDDSEEAAWDHVHVPRVWIRGEPIPVYLETPRQTNGLFGESFAIEPQGSAEAVRRIGPADFDPNWGLGYFQVLPKDAEFPLGYTEVPGSSGDTARFEIELRTELANPGIWPTASYKHSTSSGSFIVALVDSEHDLLDRGVIVPDRADRFGGERSPAGYLRLNKTRGVYTLDFDYLDLFLFGDARFPDGYAAIFDAELIHHDRVYLTQVVSVPDFCAIRAWHRAALSSEDADVAWRAAREAELDAWVLWRYAESAGQPTGAGDRHHPAEPDMSGWALRLTPRPDRVLRFPQYDRYWALPAGQASLVIPITEADDLIGPGLRQSSPDDPGEGEHRTSPPPSP